MADIINVIAPRSHRYDLQDPGSKIVFRDYDPRHPANEAYNMPAGEVCIEEGHGVEGDPAGKETPWRIALTPYVQGALSSGRLRLVAPGQDTAGGNLAENALGTLGALSPAGLAALQKKAEDIDDLVDKLAAAPDPVKWLQGAKGIGKATAEAILVELEARGLWG